MVESSKIFVCGDVNGNIKKLYSRIDNVMKKSGPFQFLLCSGNFFGENDDEWLRFKNGTEEVPVPTYILGPSNLQTKKYYKEDSGYELINNVIYLGKRGVFTSQCGITVAYVSGLEDAPDGCRLNADDVERTINACKRLRSGVYRGIDVLLTAEWPADIAKGEATKVSIPKGSKLISKLAFETKPRYHFFGNQDYYFERAPYKNAGGFHITRAIALSSVGNENKSKWLYAMNIKALTEMKDTELLQITTDTTECPYTDTTTSQSVQFFFDMDSREPPEKRKKKQNNQNRKTMVISQTDCWFCQASPKFEKHLVVSIAEETYLTLVKGGLEPFHVIIAPIAHYKSYADTTDVFREEVEKYKLSLKTFFNKYNKIPIFIDRTYKTPHYQIQVVPIPSNKLATAKKIFQEMSEEKGFSLVEVPNSASLKDISKTSPSYFYVELSPEIKLLHVIKESYFPLQFSREVLSHKSVLNKPDKVEWRDCLLSKEEEIKLSAQFKHCFIPFDFSL